MTDTTDSITTLPDVTFQWPDPLDHGWDGAWKLMADQLAKTLEELLVHFGNEDQTRAARAVLEAHEDFTSYDDCHGIGAQNALDHELTGRTFWHDGICYLATRDRVGAERPTIRSMGGGRHSLDWTWRQVAGAMAQDA